MSKLKPITQQFFLFYLLTTCVSFSFFSIVKGQIRTTGDHPLRETLQRLGGWPVLDPNWPLAKVNDTGTGSGINIPGKKLESVESLLGRLRGDYNQGVMIEQWVGPDDKNSSVNIIQVLGGIMLRMTMKNSIFNSTNCSWIRCSWVYPAGIITNRAALETSRLIIGT